MQNNKRDSKRIWKHTFASTRNDCLDIHIEVRKTYPIFGIEFLLLLHQFFIYVISTKKPKFPELQLIEFISNAINHFYISNLWKASF